MALWGVGHRAIIGFSGGFDIECHRPLVWKAGPIVQVRFVQRQVSSIIKVTGRDRAQFIQGMITNDVTGQIPQTGLRAFHLDSKGAIIYPMTLHVTSDSLYIDVEGAASQDVIASFDHFLVMERCSLKDANGDFPSYWLLGDIADIFLEDDRSSDGNLQRINVGDTVVYALPVLRRNGPCFVVWSVDIDVSSVLERAGAVLSSFDIAEAERISACIPAGCADFARILAMECGIVDKAISFKKGCYIGQEVTARIDARGRTHRELVLLEIDGETVERDVYSGENVVGHIRSTTTIGGDRTFAIAHLRNEARTEPLTVGKLCVSVVRNVA